MLFKTLDFVFFCETTFEVHFSFQSFCFQICYQDFLNNFPQNFVLTLYPPSVTDLVNVLSAFQTHYCECSAATGDWLFANSDCLLFDCSR